MNLAEVIGDTPVFNDYRQLATDYPNAKFVLNERPLDDWLASIKHLLQAMKDGLLDDKPLFHAEVKRCFLSAFSPLTETTINENAHLQQCFERHKAQVLNALGPRVITINIEDQQSPAKLCDYLDIKHDGEGFKTLNTRGQIGAWRHIDHHLKIKPNRKS